MRTLVLAVLTALAVSTGSGCRLFRDDDRHYTPTDGFPAASGSALAR